VAVLPVLERVSKANQQAEVEAILATLHTTRWNRKQAAVLLKIDYKALLYKMKKLGIDGKPNEAAEKSDSNAKAHSSGSA
jgi:DNA-binding NtrC family response regulator